MDFVNFILTNNNNFINVIFVVCYYYMSLYHLTVTRDLRTIVFIFCIMAFHCGISAKLHSALWLSTLFLFFTVSTRLARGGPRTECDKLHLGLGLRKGLRHAEVSALEFEPSRSRRVHRTLQYDVSHWRHTYSINMVISHFSLKIISFQLMS